MPSKPPDRSAAPRAARGGTLEVPILRARADRAAPEQDLVAVEAPLEIQLQHPAFGEEPVSFGATMRTPGDDEALAAGLLYGEGIVQSRDDIVAIEAGTRRPNVVYLRLRPDLEIDVPFAARRFSAGAACGVCGTTGLDAAIARAAAIRIDPGEPFEVERLLDLPQRMRAAQTRFGETGGIHCTALFDRAGNLESATEDVGRHNAFDKIVGRALLEGRLPLAERVALLSGRASFELVQKALRAGIPVLAAIGAPSSLAVQLASTAGLTLAGFLRDRQCNVYSHAERLRTGGRPLDARDRDHFTS
ncbi:MAG: formate dehydrogenase accessory sulfurtransferase FdhD [Gammaproteobacteria bacterium]|nr:formate dehydrogenase accessory sulfurtransferase FdhD [Gammaproteobacteria bacterium]